VSPILPIDVSDIDQAQIALVDEGRRLEAVPAPLTGEAPPGDPAQLFMHQGDQFMKGRFISIAPFEKKPGYLVGW
jgi:hypothetical protein